MKKRVVSLWLLCLLLVCFTGCTDKRSQRNLSFFGIRYGMTEEETALIEKQEFGNEFTEKEQNWIVYGGDPTHRWGGEKRHVYYFDENGKLDSVSLWGLSRKQLTEELGEYDEYKSNVGWYYWYGNLNGVPTTIRFDSKGGETLVWDAIGEH